MPSEKDYQRRDKFGRISQPLTTNEWIKLAAIWRLGMGGALRLRFFAIAYDNQKHAIDRAAQSMGLGGTR
jgi:hypothetical protein